MLIPEKNRIHWANQFLNEILRMMQGILIPQKKYIQFKKDKCGCPVEKLAAKREIGTALKCQCRANQNEQILIKQTYVYN